MAIPREIFQKLPKERKAEYLRALKGIKGKGDLIYLARDILGYKEVEEDVHRKVVDFSLSSARRKLILLPRGSFKTSIVTIAGCIYRMLRNPNIRILLDSEVLSNSEKILEKIKHHMRASEFVELYGHLIDTSRRETAREFTLSSRTSRILKEPSVYASGVGTVQVGPHYDCILADDLHSEKNVSTEEQILKVISHYRLLLSLLDPGGELVTVGTRWHHLDLYSYIIEEESQHPDSPWEIMVEKAIREDGSLFFPNRLTKEFLSEQRQSQGAYLYSVLYQNEPVSGETQMFRKEDFRYWTGDDFPIQDGKRIMLNVNIIIDRAFSTKESADFTGVVAAGVANSGNWYVLEAIRKKCGLQELFELIIKLGNRYGWERVRKIGVETINFEELQVFFQEQMKKQNRYFMLERMVPDSRQSKKDRIEKALQARIANHAVYFKKGMFDLEDELLRFPVGTHDDLIDALAYFVLLMQTPGDPKLEKELPDYVPSGMFGKSGY